MGCGKSKHAVATTKSFSPRKKLKSSRSKTVQNVEEPYDTKVTNVDENNNIIRSETLKVDPKQKNVINASQDESLTTQREHINKAINDVKMDLPFGSKEKSENKDILVAEEVVLNKAKKVNAIEISLESQDEYFSKIKFDEKLSPQHESIQKFASNEEEKQGILVDKDNELNNNTKLDDNLSPQHESIVKFISDDEDKQDKSFEGDNNLNNKKEYDENLSLQHESIEKFASDEEEKQDKPIEGDNYLNNKTKFYESLSQQHESIEKFYLSEEEKKDDLVDGDNDSNNKEEEKNVEGNLENINEVGEEVKVHSASIEKETMSKGEEEDVMDAMVS